MLENRETWLNYVAGRMGPVFEELGAPLPARVRIAIGFTSSGRRGKSIGECWDNANSADGHFEVFIRPDLAHAPDAMPGEIAAILAHELVHAAVGIPAGIRIGAGLAARPLPHHRAYGSVHGGSDQLTGYVRNDGRPREPR